MRRAVRPGGAVGVGFAGISGGIGIGDAATVSGSARLCLTGGAASARLADAADITGFGLGNGNAQGWFWATLGGIGFDPCHANWASSGRSRCGTTGGCGGKGVVVRTSAFGRFFGAGGKILTGLGT